MTPEELKAAYELSKRPYIECEGPIPASVLDTKSWRYLIELNTACNLRCSMCINGNAAGYERIRANEVMPDDLLEKVLAKIKTENPGAIVCPYGNGEPFLHPRLAEGIAAIKRYGFRCELATNLHYTNRMDDVLAAKPDFVIVSVSGFTQETYEKAHRGGDIEKVKANLKVLADARVRGNHYDVAVAVSYHMYNDNLHELDLMDAYTKSLGLFFMKSWARTISLENTIQAMRFLDEQNGGMVVPFAIGSDGKDWNTLLPPAKPEFIKDMDRLRFPPYRARALYARFPVSSVCIIADVFTYIRHDGAVPLCCWIDDRRLKLGNYLEMSQEQISAARRGHGLCKECLKYRLNLYYHVADCLKWDGGGFP